jgi:hypothetical protein
MADDGRRDLSRYRSEARACVNLRKHGLCDRGIVAKVYGFIECLDPRIFEPEQLHHFLRDKYLPNAILLEYLPDLFSINYSNYSEKRMNIAIRGMQQIHEVALVEYLDTYTKHILIVPGPPERVMWIDFDIAVSFKDRSKLNAKDKQRMDEELEIVKDLGKLLVCPPLSCSVFLWLLIKSRQKTMRSGDPKTHKAFERIYICRVARVNQADGMASRGRTAYSFST